MKKIIIKIINKIFNIVIKITTFFTYDFKITNSILFTDQEQNFNKVGLDRKAGIKKLSLVKNNYPYLINDLSSEHQVIFSSISEIKKCQNILEIGTYDGKNAFLLSNLFPESFIYTIDLDYNDPEFTNTYNRSLNEERLNFCNNRNNILNKNKKIIFKEMNSIKIKNLNKKFDLIWIDGAHGFPTVTIDILNSLEILNKNGLILCDDVYTYTLKNDKYYKSTATYQTIEILKKNKLISYNLFYKRVEKKFNHFKSEKKFIAIINKL